WTARPGRSRLGRTRAGWRTPRPGRRGVRPLGARPSWPPRVDVPGRPGWPRSRAGTSRDGVKLPGDAADQHWLRASRPDPDLGHPDVQQEADPEHVAEELLR